MLITCCADKGAPGVTTTTLALALTWPRPITVVEADPAGADLPYRLCTTTGDRLSLKAGLVSYAVAIRAENTTTNLATHTQTADGPINVVVGPQGPEQAAALGGDWHGVAAGLAGHHATDVIVDAGRLISGSSPAMAIATASDKVVLVVADTADAVAHLRHGVHTLTAALNAKAANGAGRAADRLGVLVVASGHTGRCPQAAAHQVRQVLQTTAGASHIPVWGALPHDVKAAAMLGGHATGRLRRRPLLKHAATCAAVLSGDTTPRAVGQEPLTLAGEKHLSDLVGAKDASEAKDASAGTDAARDGCVKVVSATAPAVAGANVAATTGRKRTARPQDQPTAPPVLATPGGGQVVRPQVAAKPVAPGQGTTGHSTGQLVPGAGVDLRRGVRRPGGAQGAKTPFGVAGNEVVPVRPTRGGVDARDAGLPGRGTGVGLRKLQVAPDSAEPAAS